MSDRLDGVIESLLAIGRQEIDPGVASADAVAIVRAGLDACEPTADAFPRAIAPPGPRRGAGLGLPLARRPGPATSTPPGPGGRVTLRLPSA
jgi:hypothetical protein